MIYTYKRGESGGKDQTPEVYCTRENKVKKNQMFLSDFYLLSSYSVI